MTKEEWVEVGLKLLGVYFGALAFVSILVILSAPFAMDLRNVVTTLGYLVAAFVLTRRGDWCLNLVCPKKRENAQEETD